MKKNLDYLMFKIDYFKQNKSSKLNRFLDK